MRLARAHADRANRVAESGSSVRRFRRLGSSLQDDELRHEAPRFERWGTLRKRAVYRGLKPVNWCFDCQSALAEAEVDYEDKTSTTIDVGFPRAGDAEREKLAKARSGWTRCPTDLCTR